MQPPRLVVHIHSQLVRGLHGQKRARVRTQMGRIEGFGPTRRTVNPGAAGRIVTFRTGQWGRNKRTVKMSVYQRVALSAMKCSWLLFGPTTCRYK